MRPGDYQLQVHIIEAKDLAGRDLSGLSDPCVVVSCFGQQKSTSTIKKVQSAVWDEHLVLEARDLTSDALSTQPATVSVYDVDTIPGNKDDLIGSFSVDLPNIYYETHHEIYRRWVVLTAPHSARKTPLWSLRRRLAGVPQVIHRVAWARRQAAQA